ncbi:MAG: hypothetical protein ACRDA4_01765 [Filifactoraceae bacterium]
MFIHISKFTIKSKKQYQKTLQETANIKKEYFYGKKEMHTLAYMRNNTLKTILDIRLKKDEVTKKIKDNKAEIENCNNKIKSIDTLLKQEKIIKK